jgi:hypothetical protein
MGASSRRSWAEARESGAAEQWIVRGEKRAGAKLTDAAVVEIRRARAQGIHLLTLAIKYGVSKAAVAKAATGVTWTHVSEPPVPRTEGRRHDLSDVGQHLRLKPAARR